MAHYKHINTSPRFLAADLQRQGFLALLRTLNHLFDPIGFDTRFCNDETAL